MPWTGAHGPTEAQKCHGCRTRYKQSTKTNLCRQCEKEAGIIDSLDSRRRAAALLEQAELEYQLEQERLAWEHRPKREITVNGVTFTVEWDGT